jgi:hypothetical protein
MSRVKAQPNLVVSLLFYKGLAFTNLFHAKSNTSPPLVGRWKYQAERGTRNEEEVNGYGVVKTAPNNQAKSPSFGRLDDSTGAADNGAGFTIVMKVIQLLIQACVKLRRSVVVLGFAG